MDRKCQVKTSGLSDEKKLRYLYIFLRKILQQPGTEILISPRALSAAGTLATISQSSDGQCALASIPGMMAVVKEMIFSVLNVKIRLSMGEFNETSIKVQNLKLMFGYLVGTMKNMAGSNNTADKMSVFDSGGIQIFLHLLEASNIGIENIISACRGLLGLCESLSIRKKLEFDDEGCDLCILSDRTKQQESNTFPLTDLPIFLNDKMVAWRIMMLLQRNQDANILKDGLSVLIHLLNSEQIQQLVLSNSNFLEKLKLMVQDGADTILQLLSSSAITACVNGDLADSRQILDTCGALILVEAADHVLSGAENGQLTVISSGPFQKLIGLLSTLCENGDLTQTESVAIKLQETNLCSRYERLLKASTVETPAEPHTSAPISGSGGLCSVEDGAARTLRQEVLTYSDGQAPLLPFGWLFRGTSLPAAVKRSPRVVEENTLTSQSGIISQKR